MKMQISEEKMIDNAHNADIIKKLPHNTEN